MDIKEKVLPLPEDEYLRQEESDWEVNLPKEYYNFLIKYNGGEPVKNCFMYNNHEYMLERFLSVLSDYKTNPLGMYDIDVVETQIGERLTANPDLIGIEKLPIAVLFAGDFICLDFKDTPDNPSVCVWFHEESDELSPVTETIAESFEDFLNMLYAAE